MPDPNWFAGHPAFSIVSHTILVAGITWAASRFIFDENKLNHYRAIIERKDAEIQALNERLSFVEKENTKYLGWLSADGQTFPSLTKRLSELEAMRKNSVDPGIARSSKRFPAVIQVMKNQAVVEESTEVVVALHEISASRKALFSVTLPGKEPELYTDRTVGDVWRFERAGKKYRMTLLELNYIAGEAKLDIRLDPDDV